MTIARWKISVQPATESTTTNSYAPASPSATERAVQNRNIRRTYEQQREEVFCWRQLHSGH
jgi:hypothetical protein